jgi:hypothetical protein
MYLLCCAGCWVLVQRDVRSGGAPFNFPGMKIVPALAIAAIVWILGQSALSDSTTGSATRAGLRAAVVVLAISSIFYLIRVQLRRKA